MLVPALDGFGGQHLLLWSTPSDDVRRAWTSTLAYTLPAPFSDIKHVYAYAAKLHPHLSDSPDELVMTYATNAWNMSEPLRQEGCDDLHAAGAQNQPDEPLLCRPQDSPLMCTSRIRGCV